MPSISDLYGNLGRMVAPAIASCSSYASSSYDEERYFAVPNLATYLSFTFNTPAAAALSSRDDAAAISNGSDSRALYNLQRRAFWPTVVMYKTASAAGMLSSSLTWSSKKPAIPLTPNPRRTAARFSL